MVGVPSAGEADLAQLAGVQRLDGLDHPRPTAALVAHLHDAFVLAGGGDHQFALAQVVAAGFLDIDMLAGRAGQDGGGRVPVIGRGNGNGVHVGLIQDGAEVLHALGFPLPASWRRRRRLFHSAAVHVADVADLGVGQGEVTGDVGHAAGVAADDGDHDLLVGALGRAHRGGAAQSGEARSEDGGLLQEIPASD